MATTQWLVKSTDRLPQRATVVLGMPRTLRSIDNFRGISEEDRREGGERRGCGTVVNCSYGYWYQRYRYTRSNVINKKILKVKVFIGCYLRKIK